MENSINSIKKILVDFKVSKEDSFENFHPRVRDRNDISVLKCNKSGVIILSRTNHMSLDHYIDKPKFKYFGNNDRKKAIEIGKDDTLRRKNLILKKVNNKNWLDFGTGSGGILDEFKSLTKKSIGVEPNKIMRNKLISAGHQVFESISETKDEFFDFVSLFHVFEHLIDPVQTLENIKRKMKVNAEILIEVPHARDFLIEFLDLKSFKDFTFWSEHIILHVKSSLKVFLERAGFKVIDIYGIQRYPLSNHLHWLRHNKPGGHIKWNKLNSEKLDLAYQEMLSSIDMNDTLVVVGKKI